MLSASLIVPMLESFFFQAEDGIRDDLVTGVQTCALPIFDLPRHHLGERRRLRPGRGRHCLDAELLQEGKNQDRKSTRLNSSHQIISYAVFCLKKKKER